MRALLVAFMFIVAILPAANVQGKEDVQSIIIEVEGDPREHEEYLRTYHPFIEVVAVYDRLFKGLALQGTKDKLKKIEALHFIKAMHPVQAYEVPQTYQPMTAEEMKKLKKEDIVWPHAFNSTSYTGKGVKVAVIDTGIDYEHPDLKTNYQSGYDLVDLDDDPMETLPGEGIPTSHGTHVAGIIAANGDLKGVAPDAEIYAYRALGPGGVGTSIQVIAALEQAVEDGADVINLSLGNSVNGPDYPTSTAVNRAVELGIPVVIANGNSGPDLWTVGSPATAAKAISVGASTHPRKIPYLYESLHKKKIPLHIMHGSVSWDVHPSSPVVDGKKTSDLHGKIALLSRGEVPFYEMAKKAESLGADAVIIANNEENMIQGSVQNADDPVTIPVAMVTKEDGEWLFENIQKKDTMLKTVYEDADVTIAPFSSRGPVTVNWQIKPDIVAPGTNVLSTVPNGYQALQGTSMAAPHVAGVIALLKEAHPEWTVDEIYSALETTAIPLETVDGELMDPAVQGNGIVQAEEAANAPTIIYNKKLEFGRIEQYREEHTIEIDIENRSNEDREYRFHVPKKEKGFAWKLPMSFTVKKYEKKTVPITLSVTTQQLEKGIHRGWLYLSEGDNTYPLPYLFINETADYPKAMGFEFSLQPLSDDTFIYRMYAAEEIPKAEVDLYEPGTLVHVRTLLTMEDLHIGMNEGTISRKDAGPPGSYIAIVRITLADGTEEIFETKVHIPE